MSNNGRISVQVCYLKLNFVYLNRFIMVQFICSLATQAHHLETKQLLKTWEQHKVMHLQMLDLTPEYTLEYYNQLLPQLGTPYSLAEDVTVGDRTQQRTGEVWVEVRYDANYPNAYRHSANAQPLHTDGSYVANFPNASLMCCVANAAVGGETVFLDTDCLVSILQAEYPQLLSDLQTVTVPHTRSGDRRNLPVLRRDLGRWLVNWNYYCVDLQADGRVLELRETFQSFLLNSPQIRESLVPVKLQPGDAVLWKDDECLHGRNAFEAHTTSERFLWKCAIDVGVFAGVYDELSPIDPWQNEYTVKSIDFWLDAAE
jgi:alpha-ketoglutarate-dependent taurine dioxygenase